MSRSTIQRIFVCLFACLLAAPAAHGVEVHVTAAALERTLKSQLFTVPGPSGKPERYYLKGSATSACAAYAEDPHVSFRDERIIVHLKTHSKLGATVHGACVGITLNAETEVSFIPQAEGESIGFRDAKIDRLSDNKELNFLLEPFLSKKLPAEMKMNAAAVLRTLLVHAPDQTGYKLTLTELKLHSMLVDGQELVADLDAKIKVE